MRYASLCSGIEAATVAWRPLGWEPAFFAEQAAFPSAVLAHHYPGVANYGDIKEFERWPDARVDLLIAGTPCQSFSIAGLRAGLDDPRGDLALVYLAAAARYRARWLVWENVTGVLSVDGGRAFGAFLGRLAECGYGFAYRVFNAGYFGVPQQRRRVYLVGYLGDWRRAAAVLFERASLQWNVAPTSGAWSHLTRGTGTSIDGDCRGAPDVIASTGNHSYCLNAGGMGRQDGRSETFVIERTGSGVRVRRLTPLECERLMGLPDNYTLVKYNGRQAKDWGRYVAIGNSMAVPVVRWIGQRIAMVDSIACAPGASEKSDALERPTVNYFDVVKGMGSTAPAPQQQELAI